MGAAESGLVVVLLGARRPRRLVAVQEAVDSGLVVVLLGARRPRRLVVVREAVDSGLVVVLLGARRPRGLAAVRDGRGGDPCFTLEGGVSIVRASRLIAAVMAS